MIYEIELKDSDCFPILPYMNRLEIGDMVSVINLQNNDRHTFIVVENEDKYGEDVCDGCDADTSVGCVCIQSKESHFDTQCAARVRCVFRLIDNILEDL